MSQITKRRGEGGGVGWLLLGLGLFFLVAPFLAGPLIGLLWPLFVLGPGLLMFYGVRRLGKGAAWLTVPASIVSMTGLLLMYGNLTNHWQIMAYGWSLIMPGSLGLGLAVYGDLARKEQISELGEGIAKVGIGLFLVGLFFFELILNISGWMGWLIPLLLIAGGALLLARRRGPHRRRARGRRVRDLLEEESRTMETPIYRNSKSRDRI